MTQTAPICSRWPGTREELIEEQLRLASLAAAPWRFEPGARVGGVFVCFARGGTGPGHAGHPAWAAACVGDEAVVVPGRAGAPYEPGLLALREGPLLEAAVRALTTQPDVLLVDATGRDHPRRAGLAIHLGEVLDLPTVGVTYRALLAEGRVARGRTRRPQPAPPRGRARRLLAAHPRGHAPAGRPCRVANRDRDSRRTHSLNKPSSHARAPPTSAPPRPRSPGGRSVTRWRGASCPGFTPRCRPPESAGRSRRGSRP